MELLRGWPEGGEERALTLRQIRAVLSCGGFRPLLAAMHSDAHPLLGGDCTTDDADVLRNWRL